MSSGELDPTYILIVYKAM
jgi:hypothetical protein